MRAPFWRNLVLFSLIPATVIPPAHAQQTPPEQQAPAAQQQPAPPPTVNSPEGSESGAGPLSVTLSYWLTTAEPHLRRGSGAPSNTVNANLDFPGKGKGTPEVEFGIPLGNGHTLRLSYFRTQGDGNSTAGSDLTLFSTDFSQSDYLSTRSTLQNAKICLDYLSWPFPVKGRFHVKTLWEVQYTTISSTIDAPLKPVTTDSSGATNSTTAQGSKWLVYPSLGLGVDHYVTRRFRWSASASGFAVPHHAAIWNAQAAALYRFGRHLEALVGERGFHVKTSPKADQYFGATLSGVYAGLRWYSD